MIPASPALVAPPIKKQRAGNTPEDPIAARTDRAISYRSERLQDLAQKYGTATRPQLQVPYQNGNGPPLMNANGPPISRQPGASVRGGGRQVPVGPPTTQGKSQQSTAPPKPNMAPIQPRKSDIFPSATKQSPITSKATTPSIATSHPPLNGNDNAIPRRLVDSFHSNGSQPSRSKSAPPNRPPPPPGPPPLVKDEPTKVVSFQSPQISQIATKPTFNVSFGMKSPESTTTPDDIAMSTNNAGATPFHSVSAVPQMTPHPLHVSPESSTPPTTGRRDVLRNMREFAETPQKPLVVPSDTSENPKSPELRLHEQLASSEKDKAAALRKVAQLQDEISKIKTLEANTSNEKHVGFLSPISSLLPSPIQNRSRRIGTPHPKSKLPKPSTPTEIESERYWFTEATKRTPFEYDTDNGITFIVRRPHGFATETDLWYKAGQLPAKLYANKASVETPSSIEVAAVIDADSSIFILFGNSDVRHQSTITGISSEFNNVEERSTVLGNISFVDKNAIDKEYSLDELYEYAISVRGHYCTTVRSFAVALQLTPDLPITDTTKPSSSSLDDATTILAMTKKIVETADKAIATDEVTHNQENKKDEQESQSNKVKSIPPPIEDDSSSDVLGSFIHLFFSTIFGTIWFVSITLPLRIVTTTFVITVSVVLLSYIWMFLIDENHYNDYGSMVRLHSNQPGIM